MWLASFEVLLSLPITWHTGQKKKWGQGQHGRILNLFLIKDCLSVEVCHKEKEKAINENYEMHQAEKTSNMKVTERTNNLYRQNLCFSSQGNLRANLRANRNWFSFYIHMHRTFYMFTTSCKPIKAIYKIYGVCRVKKPHCFPNSSLMTMFLSCLISSYIYIFCDQTDIPQWRGPKASVKIENNIENTLCVCSLELQQAQMWLSAILYQLWGFWKHIIPSFLHKHALLAESTQKEYNKPASWAVNMYRWKVLYKLSLLYTHILQQKEWLEQEKMRSN